ncbi:Hypothetical predicted protein [Pelobates cultripes]|uniref:Uncharacterized protein n=1 Tax=Pelobates cultripes TaxID=61616 RepID=A0AAD1QZ20_PELCU|nr:Hypothetical predicted protein [Pelobates cultripes]
MQLDARNWKCHVIRKRIGGSHSYSISNIKFGLNHVSDYPSFITRSFYFPFCALRCDNQPHLKVSWHKTKLQHHCLALPGEERIRKNSKSFQYCERKSDMAALNLTTASKELITVQPTTIIIPWLHDGTGAACFIISVVGFFGLIMFFLLIINLCNDEDTNIESKESHPKKEDSSKLSPKTVPCYKNTAAFIETNRSRKGSENHKNTEQRQNKTATTTSNQNVTVVVSTIS